MSIQSTLTLAIEIIFWAFVSLMIFDFIDGLYVVPLPPQSSVAQPQVVSSPTPSVLAPQLEPISNSWELEPQQITVISPQFESIPDPWKLELDSSNSTVKTQSIVLPLPALRLLTPVQEVQPKRTRTTKKTTSTAKTKSEKAESPRKSGRPRNQAA